MKIDFLKKQKKRPTSLTLRVAIGKLIGAGIGLIVFLSLPTIHSDIALVTQFGMWGWYILFGAVIGFSGIYTSCPLTGWPLPPLLRGAMVGFGMNLILGALMYEDIMAAFAAYSDFHAVASAPVLQMAFEGLIWGALIDKLVTTFAGEGKNLTKKL